MDLKRKLCYESIFVLVLFIICSCASAPKQKEPYLPEEKVVSERPEIEEPEEEPEQEILAAEKHSVEKEIIEEELLKKKYTGIEGEFYELPTLQDVSFAFDKYDLTSQSCKILADNLDLLKQIPNVKIQIEGHCDERGSDEYNLVLGERRANAAKNYLISLNFLRKNISTISYGEEMPVDTGHNEEAWSKNRRVHIIILSYGSGK